MARVSKATILKNQIIRVASSSYLNKGFTNTTNRMIAEELDISVGSVTFHFPSKEHLLAELVELLCQFQWKMIQDTVEDGNTPLLAMCMELTAMAAICEEDEIARDFYISAYTHPLTLGVIQRNDRKRAEQIFGEEHCEGWTKSHYSEVETLVSGIEYTALMVTECSPSLEVRITGALDAIMTLYGIPEETRKMKIDKVLKIDYRALGRSIMNSFKEYIENKNEQVLEDLLERRKKGLE